MSFFILCICGPPSSLCIATVDPLGRNEIVWKYVCLGLYGVVSLKVQEGYFHCYYITPVEFQQHVSCQSVKQGHSWAGYPRADWC